MQELRAKGLSYSQVAKVLGCSKANVVLRMQGYAVEMEDVREFKEHESDVLTSLRYRLTKNITDDEIKNASIGTRVLAYCQLYDKYRLETGQSTDNHAVIHSDIQAIKALDNRVSDAE